MVETVSKDSIEGRTNTKGMFFRFQKPRLMHVMTLTKSFGIDQRIICITDKGIIKPTSSLSNDFVPPPFWFLLNSVGDINGLYNRSIFLYVQLYDSASASNGPEYCGEAS